eukprot:RCo023869
MMCCDALSERALEAIQAKYKQKHLSRKTKRKTLGVFKCSVLLRFCHFSVPSPNVRRKTGKEVAHQHVGDKPRHLAHVNLHEGRLLGAPRDVSGAQDRVEHSEHAPGHPCWRGGSGIVRGQQHADRTLLWEVPGKNAAVVQLARGHHHHPLHHQPHSDVVVPCLALQNLHALAVIIPLGAQKGIRQQGQDPFHRDVQVLADPPDIHRKPSGVLLTGYLKVGALGGNLPSLSRTAGVQNLGRFLQRLHHVRLLWAQCRGLLLAQFEHIAGLLLVSPNHHVLETLEVGQVNQQLKNFGRQKLFGGGILHLLGKGLCELVQVEAGAEKGLQAS